MFKVLIFLKKKAGISEAEFRDYYERRHAKLSLELAPALLKYKRNYVVRDMSLQTFGNAAGSEAKDFDVVTEICFADAASFDATMQYLSTPEISHRLIEDELRLFERSATRHYMVEELESTIA